MADATVLNTVGLRPCGFESRLRHTAALRGAIRVDRAGRQGAEGQRIPGCRHTVFGPGFRARSWSPTAGESLEMAMSMSYPSGCLIAFLGLPLDGSR